MAFVASGSRVQYPLCIFAVSLIQFVGGAVVVVRFSSVHGFPGGTGLCSHGCVSVVGVSSLPSSGHTEAHKDKVSSQQLDRSISSRSASLRAQHDQSDYAANANFRVLAFAHVRTSLPLRASLPFGCAPLGFALGAQAPLTPPSPNLCASQQVSLCANARGRGARCAQLAGPTRPLPPICRADVKHQLAPLEKPWMERFATARCRAPGTAHRAAGSYGA